ncbi:hypothetical protein ERO13_A09G249200v2 [Gossypium hirsutum]|uniref:Uncharacterized protein n=1 Tax=Gossypium darwinii TaxID=34276 RepID=A0A5D2FET2_GOSDA|nr:hypothetical protein ERO13_A09G249200v2 [Gossypium hirsutum]TYH04361.1 hypothetical protein ES288_A09G292100v1 [Gossypium darwinii]
MSLIQFRLTMSFSTSSMADLPSFSTEEFYWLASCFWGIITCKLVNRVDRSRTQRIAGSQSFSFWFDSNKFSIVF